MASTSVTHLAEQLREAGFSLLHSPSSVEELLVLIDKAEDLLFSVEQAPPSSVKEALLPMMKALKSDALLKHPESVVRVSVASCIHEIARITAPLEPYGDELMKEIFELTVSSFENLSRPSTRCYEKAASIVYTIARVRSCVVMLDLECDGLVVEMFRHFLKTTGSNHPEDVLWAMETIMTLVLEETEDISMDLLEPLLASVQKVNEKEAPISWKLGESVISNCTQKLKPVLRAAVQSSGIDLALYAPVIASICGSSSDKSELLANGSRDQGAAGSEYISTGEDSSSKSKSSNLLEVDGVRDLGSQSGFPRKRDRRPNSLMNPDEGYEHLGVLDCRKSRGSKLHESPTSKDSQEGKKRRFSRKRAAVALTGTDSDGDGKLLVSCEQRRPGKLLNRERASSSAEIGIKRKKRAAASDNEKTEVSRKKKVGLSSSTSSIKDGVSSKTTKGTGSRRDPAPPKEERDVGEEIVGRKIKVWWPKDRVFYDGVIRLFDRRRKRHMVLYNDGIEERLNLKKQRWKLIEDEASLDECTTNPKHSELPELLLDLKKKKKRSKSTDDSSPFRIVKRAGASPGAIEAEPSSNSYDKDEPAAVPVPALVENNEGNVPPINGSVVVHAKT